MGRAITVQNISKQFKITAFRDDSLRFTLQQALKFNFYKKVPFEALRDISFEIEEGEVFGIIGVNGSGKSTLLKILSKIMFPTSGHIELFGKINTLLEVGTGFHPELTGRENVFLNGSILGLRRHEIKSKFDEIVDFSGVEQFLETPVKHYSSGMFVRLAFAVAAHLDPDILIVDEVLSVGDHAFQQKCMRKMEEEVLQGRTVLFVSHNMDQVQKLCNRVMLLDQGRCHTIGDPSEVIQSYLGQFRNMEIDAFVRPEIRQGNGRIRYQNIEVINQAGQNTVSLIAGENVVFRLHYQGIDPALRNVNFRILIKSATGQIILALISKLYLPAARLINKSGEIDCVLPKLPLNVGRYF
ncbi:MAG: ABC transporter ATP-binding protein [Saprospiraceae bacterium]|nr:ABC transporter ATP-binding protein [Saprospiraceae bacterium]